MQGAVKGQGGPRQGRWTAVIAVVAVLSVACGGGGDDEASPSPTIAEPTTPTTSDPYAVPAVIDAAYVNRVLEGIDAAVGDIFRLVIQTRDIPPEVIDRVKAVYLHREDMNFLLTGLQHNLSTEFAGYRPNPGNRRSTVQEMIAASPSCVFVRVSRDYSEQLATSERVQGASWIGLAPKDPTSDPAHFNPTPWVVTLESLVSDAKQPVSPCGAS